MTPQENFMVLAPIDLRREAELRRLLGSMNASPGQADPTNTLVPFGRCAQLHFARLLILDDRTQADIRVYDRPVPIFPLYLAFLGDVDGEANTFLAELATVAADGLRAIFSCCQGFTGDLMSWMQAHRAPALASYVNWRGRTVRTVHEEAALRETLHTYLRCSKKRFAAAGPPKIHQELQRFVEDEKAAGRLALTPEAPTPVEWELKNFLHKIGLPLLVLLASPLLLVLAPFLLVRLRALEKSDAELCERVDQAHSDELAYFEDRDVTNQFTAMGSLKPGLVRLATVIGVLGTVDYAARHIVRPGRLGRIRTIHFARWVFLDGTKRMVFFSNYDGTVESYMDDFINKTGFGLNAVFSNGIGYPRTNWLVRDGCADEQKYKNFLRRHTLPTQVWYKAYPGLTAIDLERNGRVRRGLEATSLSEEEARAWLALL